MWHVMWRAADVHTSSSSTACKQIQKWIQWPLCAIRLFLDLLLFICMLCYNWDRIFWRFAQTSVQRDRKQLVVWMKCFLFHLFSKWMYTVKLRDLHQECFHNRMNSNQLNSTQCWTKSSFFSMWIMLQLHLSCALQWRSGSWTYLPILNSV